MSLDFEKRPLLVLVGAFNSQIMRDVPWVTKFLFPKSTQNEITVNMNVATMSGELSSSMTIDGIKLDVNPGKVRITPREFTPSGYNDIIDLATNLAGVLPHTPLMSYGINCCFIDQIKKPILQNNRNILKFLGTVAISDYIKITHQTEYKNSIMTFTISEKKEGNEFFLLYDFNFHFVISEGNITPMMQMKNAMINGDIKEYLDHAKSIALEITSSISSKNSISSKK